jgi:hypothetical protein
MGFPISDFIRKRATVSDCPVCSSERRIMPLILRSSVDCARLRFNADEDLHHEACIVIASGTYRTSVSYRIGPEGHNIPQAAPFLPGVGLFLHPAGLLCTVVARLTACVVWSLGAATCGPAVHTFNNLSLTCIFRKKP